MERKILTILYTKKTIQERVSALAEEIYHDYHPRELLLVGVLKGAFIFLADLARALTLPVSVDFVRVSSYGSLTVSSGMVNILKDVETPLTGKDVIIVEDIIDTGFTTAFLKNEFSKRKPRSLKICTLLDKRLRRRVDLDADYVGITMDEDHFVVGYGLDCAEKYRSLSDIYFIES
ncbi:MAG: hypoxanthine phosphoribosyltransferase [Deltaproteobacteria bacterium]|nr:hypoxanthine phosphoribosyltransferase [Deltaproteobacteria bacterium]